MRTSPTLSLDTMHVSKPSCRKVCFVWLSRFFSHPKKWVVPGAEQRNVILEHILKEWIVDWIMFFNSDLGAIHGLSMFHMPSTSVQYTDLQCFTCHRPRCNTRTFSVSHAIDLGAIHEPSIFHMPSTSVQYTDLQCFKCHRPRYNTRTFNVSNAIDLGAQYASVWIYGQIIVQILSPRQQLQLKRQGHSLRACFVSVLRQVDDPILR